MTQVKYISLANGDIQFIKRGDPPMVVPGYEVDAGDPYIFHPVLPPCQYRTFKLLVLSCCPSGKNVRHCTKFGFLSMPPETCISCVKMGLDQK